MPLGSPKYIPPVNSLTIIISRPSIISFFNADASTRAGKHIAGRRLANKSKSFLNLKRPASGLFSYSTFSHFGPPTAPKRTASDFFASVIASSEIAVLLRS